AFAMHQRHRGEWQSHIRRRTQRVACQYTQTAAVSRHAGFNRDLHGKIANHAFAGGQTYCIQTSRLQPIVHRAKTSLQARCSSGGSTPPIYKSLLVVRCARVCASRFPGEISGPRTPPHVVEWAYFNNRTPRRKSFRCATSVANHVVKGVTSVAQTA